MVGHRIAYGLWLLGWLLVWALSKSAMPGCILAGSLGAAALEIALTALADRYLRVSLCAQLSAQLRGLDVGTVTVGTAYSALYSPLARIISDFHARYGGIQVQLRGGYSTELITQLNAHQLDLCFIPAREGGHDWLPIGYDELTAWVPAAHPMA